jgi:hypothetical protein
MPSRYKSLTKLFLIKEKEKEKKGSYFEVPLCSLHFLQKPNTPRTGTTQSRCIANALYLSIPNEDL